MQYLMHSKYVELKERLASAEGATAVEYGVMVALIIAVLIGVVTAVGTSTSTTFAEVNNAL